MINTMCYNFQKKIIDDFNAQEDIPFILKFYLFKDIWEMIEQEKLILIFILIILILIIKKII